MVILGLDIEIPTLPIYIILSFYDECEYWDIAGKDIVISDSMKTISHQTGNNHWDNTSYGKSKILSTEL